MNSKQRAFLRGLANTISPIFQVGKGGLSAEFIEQIDSALEARELIKIHVLNNSSDDIHFVAEELSRETNCEVVQIMGNKITLFRQSTKKPKIELP